MFNHKYMFGNKKEYFKRSNATDENETTRVFYVLIGICVGLYFFLNLTPHT